DRDFFACAEDDIADTTALLTVVGGRIVWGAGPFSQHDAPIPPAMPDWSPVRQYGGYGAWGGSNAMQRDGAPLARAAAAAMCGCASACNVHGHAHAGAWGSALPTSDVKGFWGAFGCSCWAI
ncbi:amidohydrolase, partial [Paraburkholderia sp. RG36]|nr:amidohydrolase [Paraburkholderia tagetis]